MAMSIQDMSSRLNGIARQLNQVTDISTFVNQIAEESKQVVSMYKEMIEVQGNDLETKKKPNQVDVQHLKQEIDKFKTALGKATTQMKVLENEVHSAIRDCAVEQTQHNKVIRKGESVITNLESEKTEYKVETEESSKKAAKSEKEAENCRNMAREMERNKETTVTIAAAEGAFIVLTSLFLAQVAGGASLLAATASLAVTGGGLMAVDALRKKEERYNSIAREEREKANEARNKMSQIEKEINTCRSNITISRDRIRMLQDTVRTLDGLRSFLLSFITVKNRVEVFVQDLETSMQRAVDFGSTFSMIQLELSECPLEFEDTASEGLLELRSKWKAVEDEIRKMISI